MSADVNMKAVHPIIIKPGENIGTAAAETDSDYLDECFIEHPALNELKRMQSPKMVALGRTGTGKTAIIKKILDGAKYSSEFNLRNMSLNYIANSSEIKFLQSLGVDLEYFFEFLWKHVLFLEVIRVAFNLGSSHKATNSFLNIFQNFKNDKRKKDALDYLKDCGSEFWIPMESSIQVQTNKLETKIEADFSAELFKFSSNAGYVKTLSDEKKTFLCNKAKKLVNSEKLTKLNSIIEMLSEYQFDRNMKCCIAIDRIDENWVEDSLRFRLIQALLGVLGTFLKFDKVKVIIAMRSDVLHRVITNITGLSLQNEKIKDFVQEIRWNSNSLRELVESRIGFMCKKKYVKDNVCFDDIFSFGIDGKNPFDYILERTLYRPRDVIDFVNFCLLEAQNKSEVSVGDIKEAEYKYSSQQYHALLNEWKSTFPNLKKMLDSLRNSKKFLSARSFLSDDFFEDLTFSMIDSQTDVFDPFVEQVNGFLNDGSPNARGKLICGYLEILYRVGVLGIKRKHDEYFRYSHANGIISNLSPKDLIDSKVQIHPMFHRELGIEV